MVPTEERSGVVRVLRTTVLGLFVLAFLFAALAVGYGLRHHRTIVVRERAARATVGVVPWSASMASSTSSGGAGSTAGTTPASAAAATATASGAQPPPLADLSNPGVALASGGVDLGNPSVLADGSGFYLYSSQSTPFLNVPVVYAPTQGSWGTETDALPTIPPWAGVGVVTAPEVHQFGSEWDLYFAAPVKGGSAEQCIGSATATSPAGPFSPAPQPIVCQSTRGGSSDASVFVDSGGTPYLVWTSADSEVWSQPLASDGLSLVGQPASLYQPDLTWQDGELAAPSLVLGNGGYWLLYSAGGGFTSSSDAIGAAACSGPSGPCADQSTAPLLTSNSQGTGPGDPSVLLADGEDWLVYNPSYSAGEVTPRSVDAARLGFGSSGPYLATPGVATAPAQSTPAGSGSAVSDPGGTVAGTSAGAATGPTVGAAGITTVEAAVSQLGVPYLWGGESPASGFDCSGLVQWAWSQAGVAIPRTAAAQYAALPHVSLTALSPGDLLFYFNLDGDNTIDHVVMYVGSGPDGNQTIVQAPETGSTVSYAPVFTSGLVGAARP